MANFVYNYGKFLLANGGVNLVTDSIVLMLVNASYTGASSNANSNVVSEVSSYEITATNYTRQALASKSVVEDDANTSAPGAYFKAANVTFQTLLSGNTIGGAILLKNTGSDATSGLIAFYDITDTPTNGGDITIQWAADASGGVLKLA